MAWPLRNGYFKGPLMIWVGEVAVGLVVLAGMAAASRRARPDTRGVQKPDRNHEGGTGGPVCDNAAP